LDLLSLEPGEVHFFYTSLDDTKHYPGLIDLYAGVISEEEKQKKERYVFEKDRHTSLVTRALLRYVLWMLTGQDPAGFKFSENAYGRPEPVSGTLPMPIRFNLSHSGGLTACAVALNTDIGCDLEDCRRAVDINIVDRFFSKPEADYLGRYPEPEKSLLFFEFWTLKESYIKARGMGLSIDLGKFSFDLTGPEVKVDFHESLDDDGEQWRFFRFKPMDHYTAAVSVQSIPAVPVRLNIHKCIPFMSMETTARLISGAAK